MDVNLVKLLLGLISDTLLIVLLVLIWFNYRASKLLEIEKHDELVKRIEILEGLHKLPDTLGAETRSGSNFRVGKGQV